MQGAPENATPPPPMNEAARVACVDRLGCISFPTKDTQGNVLTSLVSLRHCTLHIHIWITAAPLPMVATAEPSQQIPGK